MPTDAPDRRLVRREVWIVLGLSLGQSAVYAVISIVAKLTRPEKLAEQTTTINPTQSVRPLLDLVLQLTSIFFALVPVALALYLLARDGGSPFRRIGFDVPSRGRALRDVGWGAVLAAVIGLPGLGFYFLARGIGINTNVAASGLTDRWSPKTRNMMASSADSLVRKPISGGIPAIESAARPPSTANHGTR